ncbi:DUF2948 family protein [Phenylobacterium sp.]|jgi:hypothetical protein|uniref:DUF2948 family protein n=1 Tax=Phenylobacterium sp. TaxID=1871053 RepID=UPI002F428E71
MAARTAPLRLLAQDADDLAVISAAMQDAVAKVGDISFEPKARRLTIALNRYCWEAGSGVRVRSGLQLGGVLNVQARKIRRGTRDAVVEVLALTFEPGEAPGGVVTISCAGGGDLRAEVECVDAVLADVSQPWPTPRAPKHAD